MVENIITLIIGIATFIIGMNMMSGGLKKSTGKGVKKIFKKTENNRLIGMGIGAGVTALIQSSAATSIMVIGFVSACVMTVFQGVSVILGAYIGTTITGILVSLSSFDFSKYFVLLAAIGVIMMFFKNEKVKNIGEILAGLGLLFFGLSTMSSSVAIKSQTGNTLTELGSALSKGIQSVESLPINPLLFLLIGALITALLQSSSATSGIVIVMVGSGAISIESGLYLVLGATIGTVITTIIASIGGNANVKRTALICLFIRITTALIALGIIWPTQALTNNGISQGLLSLFNNNSQFAVAMFLVLYNVIFMFLVLPFLKPIVKLFEKLIKDKNEEKIKNAILYINKNLLDSPELAIGMVTKEIIHMFQLAYQNYKLGYEEMISGDISNSSLIETNEEKIDYINNAITDYLIQLNPKANKMQSKIVGGYFHVINDIERIGDHADNFSNSAIKMKNNDLKFSATATKEFNQMNEIIEKMFSISLSSLENQTSLDIEHLHELENQTDKLKVQLEGNHFSRITKNECKVELSPYYSTFLSELERVADHLVNIGYVYINPTGDEEK